MSTAAGGFLGGVFGNYYPYLLFLILILLVLGSTGLFV